MSRSPAPPEAPAAPPPGDGSARKGRSLLTLVAIVSLVLIGAAVGIGLIVFRPGATSQETPAKTTTPAGPAVILYSQSADHSRAVPLEGATVSGDIWAFTRRTSGISEVDFSVDGELVNTERRVPYELGRPPGFDTRALANGEHTLTVLIRLADGGTQAQTVTFTVDNADAPPSRASGDVARDAVVQGVEVLRFDLADTQLGRQTEQDLERIVEGEDSIRHGGIGTEDTFVCDGVMGDICPDYAGAEGRVLAFRHPARTHYAGTWNGLIRFSDMQEGWLTYKVRYGTTWDNTQTRGKLWGLGGVSESGSDLGKDRPPMHGADADPGDGWSARRVVKEGGQIIDYLYDPAKDRPPFDDNPFGDRAWWGAVGSTDGSNSHVDGWDRGKALVENGKWMEFAQHIDVEAGLIESYLDGKLMSRVTSRPLVEAASPINALLAHAYIGSEDSGNNVQTKEVWTYITDISVVQTR